MHKEKPTLSRRDASRRVAEAGAAALEAARADGADPRHVAALFEPGQVVDIASLKIRPLTLDVFLCLEDYWRSQWAPESRDGIVTGVGLSDLLRTLYCYIEPLKARESLAAQTFV